MPPDDTAPAVDAAPVAATAPAPAADPPAADAQTSAPAPAGETTAAAEVPEPDAEPLLSAQAHQEAQQQALADLRTTWRSEAEADPELGGPKLAENLAAAQEALKASTTPALQALLEKSGLGDHPEMIRHFLRLAPLYRNDKVVPGGQPPVKPRTAAEILYPSIGAK